MSVQAVAAVLRFAADTVPGVRARRCGITATDAPDFAVEVEMGVAVDHRGFSGDTLDVIRERVTAAASARVGVRLARLDLTLDDLFDV